MHRVFRPWFLILAGLGGACTPTLDGAEDPVTAPAKPGNSPRPGMMTNPASGLPQPPTPGTPASAPGCTKTGVQAGPAPLSRLTNNEYRNTLRDLFPRVTLAGMDLPAEVATKGFLNNARAQTPSAALIDDFRDNSRDVAAAAVADLTRVLPCKATTPAEEMTCGPRFLEAFGKQAFRRPLTADELSRYGKFMTDMRTRWGFMTAVRLTIEALLQSPHFLYRIENGGRALTSGGAIPLDSYQLASRLSYFLLDTMPDAPLMAAADAGKLASADGVATEARRLLMDARARTAVASFASQWLRFDTMDNLVKAPDLYPKFNADVARALKDATLKYVDHYIWDEGRTLGTLLTDGHAYVNDKIGAIYGKPTAATAMTLTAVDATQRSGLLTQAGLLAGFAHERSSAPVLRGVFLLDRWLCAAPPSPPADVNTSLPELKANATLTTRQQLERSHASPTCAACHRSIDGAGFGLENFDAIGQWRSKEFDLQVDARGELVGTQDVDGTFNGPVELGKKLAVSTQVRQCVIGQWMGYALGTTHDEIDACAVEPVEKALLAANGDLRELMVAVTRGDAFRHRPSAP